MVRKTESAKKYGIFVKNADEWNAVIKLKQTLKTGGMA